MTVLSTAPVRSRRTQAERRAESDQRLLGAAAELITLRGIEGASLAEIGRRAGYSHGLVHRRFGSKDALIERLNAEAVELFTAAATSRIGGARGADAVRILAETYFELVHGPDAIARVHLVIWSEAVACGAGRRPYRAVWDQRLRAAVADMIGTGLRDGSIRADLDPAAAAVLIVGLLRGAALQLLLDPQSGDVSAARSAVLDHLDRILRT